MSSNPLLTLPNLTNQITRKDPFPQEGGAFGTVWRCIRRTESTEMEVAVKTLRVHSNGVNDNLFRELIIWRRLSHENIVPLHGIASGFGPNNSISMVSTWFTNGTLTTFLASQHDTLQCRQRLDLLQDIAAGMQYLHAFKVVHGNLSGNNVLINSRGKACLTDFGLSTACGGFQGASYFGQAGRHGAIRWAAPELIVGVGQHSTFESDVYSFGSIMIQVLSGEVPWSEVAAEHIIIQKLSDGQIPRRPSTVSRTHWKFIRKCWLPSHRNSTRPSASEIVDYLNNTQIHVRRSPDLTLRHITASLVHWITARITSPASRRQVEPGSDGAPRVLKDTATNCAAIHAKIEPRSNERSFIPNENVINHAFVHDDTRNKYSNVETLNKHPILGVDIDTNQQSSQAGAETSTHLVLGKNDLPLDFEGDLVNQIDRLHKFPIRTGSFSNIWQCDLHTDPGVQVAVKALKRFDASQQASIRKKLLRQRLYWPTLEHRNIVHFYGTTSDFSVLPALVIAWMPNGTLTEYLDKQFSYLTVSQRFRLVNDVTSGLCHLHSQSIVHGDLTGSNVLIDGSGRACLTDYDLADIIASSATNMTTSTTSTLHSPDAARWAAPELIPQEDAVDPRPTKSSDIYSFGCIMLQILVGRLPYWWVRRSIHVNNEKAQGTLPMQDDPDVPKLHGRHVVFLKSCWEFFPESRPSSDYAASFVAAELQELGRR